MYVSQIMDCFRDFDQKIILVKGIDQRTLMIIKLAGFHVRPDDNAMLVFCYIDREAGISYELLCAAHIFDDGEVAFEPGNDDTSYKFRYGTFQGEIADIKGYKPFGQFAGKVQMIVDHYSAPEDILEVRRIQQLDMSRAQGFPDDGWSSPLRALASLTLPALTTGITAGASIMRYTRAAVGDMASSQAVDMAMACGMTRTQAVLRVALRLATPQLVSVIGLTFAQMITGVMVVENLFALPGLGAMLVTDVGNRDLIAVQSELFLLAAFFLLLGLVVDVAHRALDPRLKTAGITSGKATA